MARAAKRAKGTKGFVGRRVAVAFNLHRCARGKPKVRDEACFSIRDKPSSSSKVLAYVQEVWLEDVAFFVRSSAVEQIQEAGVRNVCCFIVGTVITAPRKKPRARGWSAVRLDVFDEGCFYRATTGSCVRSAKYVHLRDRAIQAFHLKNGDPFTSLRELEDRVPNPGVPIYGPRRATWRGDLGGLNFELADGPDTAAAVHWVLERHPNCVIIDGSDDWNAPPCVRPQPLVQRYGLSPVAWWHTGTSGQAASGVVLTAANYEAFARAYRREWGFEPEKCPGTVPTLERPACGCWGGEGLRIYRL